MSYVIDGVMSGAARSQDGSFNHQAERFYFVTGELDDGTHTLVYSAYDRLENMTTGSIQFVIDSTVPNAVTRPVFAGSASARSSA